MTSSRRQLANLGPLEQLCAGRMPRRLVQLFAGLALYGFSMALLLRSALGATPWDVLSTGLIRHFPMSFGTMTIISSAVVLLIWIPLKQMPGLGTVANAFFIGIAADVTLAAIPPPDGMLARIFFMTVSVLLNGLATALYLGSQLGPGPRDGLMTGISRVSGRSIRSVRTCIEITVVMLGFALGGVLGIGTALYAFAIGPLAQLMLPWFTVELEIPPRNSKF
ncbi:MAG: hypothetical protein EOP84_30650 [Verrucomicrobiaceae bacterium]|nr:MAG: hypothetical protein EOP84_30650 [Verrucomicrobiaceae bacterium]